MPHQSTQALPVCWPMRPLASITCSWRCSRPSAGAMRRCTSSGAGTPAPRSCRPWAPKCGLTSACVESAPMPLCACGQSAPTAKKRVAMATPNAPLASRAMMDHVMRRDDTHKISRCYAWPMRLAIAVGCCAVLAAATALDADAGRGRSGGGGRGHASGSHNHHFHGGARVFVCATLVSYPRAYYLLRYCYAAAGAWPSAYWYYCAAAGAYYPYVQNCPGGWELVLPTAPAYTGY